jgi:hypothetical protein
LTFASPAVSPSQLAKASGTRHQIAKVGIIGEASLQLSVLIVIQIPGNMTSESGASMNTM